MSQRAEFRNMLKRYTLQIPKNFYRDSFGMLPRAHRNEIKGIGNLVKCRAGGGVP